MIKSKLNTITNKKYKFKDKDKLFFTSDTHFWHNNIIRFCNRPFSSVEEMNDILISNWNAKVPPDGHIFFLGDFILKGSISMAKDILNRLNGTIYWIFGNHDYQNKLNREQITNLVEFAGDALYITIIDKEMTDGYQKIYMSHYPMLSWDGNRRGSWQLFGHIHSSVNTSSIEAKNGLKSKLTSAQYDVGVDNNNFTPISYEEVKSAITQQYLNKL